MPCPGTAAGEEAGGRVIWEAGMAELPGCMGGCQCRGRHMLAETLIRGDEELILRIVSRLSIAMVCVDDLIEN